MKYLYNIDVYDFSLGSDCPVLYCSFPFESSFSDVTVTYGLHGRAYIHTFLGVVKDEEDNNNSDFDSLGFPEFICSRFCRYV